MITAKEAREQTEKAKQFQFNKAIEDCFESISQNSDMGNSNISWGDMGQYPSASERVFDPKHSLWNKAKEILEKQGFKVEAVSQGSLSYTNISW